MTREEILAMEVGRELDDLVADVVGLPKPYFDMNAGCVKPKYSMNISAAWRVVEKVRYRLSLKQELDGTWWAGFGYPCVMGDGKTAPEAICKAALLAKLGTV